MLKKFFIILIRGYQIAISPLLPPACRFYPSCSEYGLEAVKTHGAIKGGALTVWRLLRCQPLAKSGYDPVPLKKNNETPTADGANKSCC